MKAKLKLSWDFNRTKIEKDTEVTIIKGMEADAEILSSFNIVKEELRMILDAIRFSCEN